MRRSARFDFWLVALLATACGGRSHEDIAPARGGGGDATAAGGSTSAGGSGASTDKGGSSAGGATSTGGSGGSPISGGGTGGTATECHDGDATYPVGATYPSSDGCNQCTCTVNGPECTEKLCTVTPTCDELLQEQEDAYREATMCTPGSPGACSVLTEYCNCKVYVNDASQLAAIDTQIKAGHCVLDQGRCPECPTIGANPYCTTSGQCASADDIAAGGAAGAGGSSSTTGSCVAGGNVYSVGAGYVTDGGCTSCKCATTGFVCTSLCGSDECVGLANEYDNALLTAEMCTPGSECTVLVHSPVSGCPLWVSDNSYIDGLAAYWKALGCTSPPPAPCAEPAMSSACGSDGTCTQ